MKNLLKLLVIVLGLQIANAQEFEKTDTYKVSISPIINDKEYTQFSASVVSANNPDSVLTSFKIQSPNRIKNVTIESLKHPDLLNIEEIIKMEITYCEPSVYTISKYVLVTNNQEFVDLPAIVNMTENNPKSETMYVFPNQTFGETNKIIKLEITYSDKIAIENIDILKAFAWSDDDFMTSEVVSRLY